MSDLPQRQISGKTEPSSSTSPTNRRHDRIDSFKSLQEAPPSSPSGHLKRSPRPTFQLPHSDHQDTPTSSKPKEPGTPSGFSITRNRKRCATVCAASVERKTLVSGGENSDPEEDTPHNERQPPLTPSVSQQRLQGGAALLREILDGQQRLEDELRRLSGRFREDLDELKVTLKSLRYYDCEFPQRIHSDNSGVEYALREAITNVSPKHDDREVTFKCYNSNDSSGKYSSQASLKKRCPDHSSTGSIKFPIRSRGREGDSAAGSPLAEKEELLIRIERADLIGCSDSDEIRCVVTIDGQFAFETGAWDGSTPQWQFEKSVPFHEEEVLQFAIMVNRAGGPEQGFGIATLQLCDCRDGYKGSLSLIKDKPEIEEESPVSDRPVGELSVSMSFLKLADPNALCISSSLRRRPSRLANTFNSSGSLQRSSTMSPQKSTPSRMGRRASVHFPANIEVRPQLETWMDSQEDDELEQSKWIMRHTLGSGGSIYNSEGIMGVSRFDRCLPVVKPTSKKRLAYDLISLMVLLHDMASIPYALAWNIAFEGWFKIASWFTCMFWLNDVFFNFFTGYCEDGQEVTRWSLVAKHYLKTWFWLDVPLVTVDLVCVFGSEILAGGIWRITRVFRFIRIISLFRVFRITTNFDNVLDRTLTDAWRSMYVVVWLMVSLLWMGHVTCCFWYWLGLHGGALPGHRWFDSLDWRNEKFISQAKDYQYFTSFHWALSQIAGGGVEVIAPLNTYERIFNVVCIVLGVLFGTTLVSILSTTMIEIRMSQQEKLGKIRAVRQYLVQNNIEARLAMRVQKNLNEHFKKEQRLSQKEVPALNHLSKFLRMELRFAIVGKHFLSHPLFNLFYKMDPDTMQTICYDIVKVFAYSPGDMVFFCGNKAEDVFYVIAGMVQYSTNPMSFQGGTIDEDDAKDCQLVEPDTWLARVALWTQWRYVGNAIATSLSELLAINAEGLLEIIMARAHPTVAEICREYGNLFHQCVVTGQRNYTNDLDVQHTDYPEMVLEMRENVRTIIGMVALSKIKKEKNTFREFITGDLAKLEAEVMSGKSTVLENWKGDVERIVAVAVLDLVSEDGRMLVQVGKCEHNGKLHVVNRLPGHHQSAGRSNMQALMRFIDTELDFLKDDNGSYCITLDETTGGQNPSTERETKESPNLGHSTFRTTYIRTTYRYTLDAGCSMVPHIEMKRSSRRLDLEEFGRRSSTTSMRSSKTSMRSSKVEPNHARLSQSHVEFPDSSVVFAVPSVSHSGMHVYAWIHEKDKEFFLNKHANEQSILRWLESLNLDFARPSPSKERRSSRPHLNEVFHPFSVLERLVGSSPPQPEVSINTDRADHDKSNGLQPLNGP